jgi:large subunit ribosomal protein L30
MPEYAIDELRSRGARAGGKMADTEQKKLIKVTQVRSTIGYNRKQREIVRSLGLRRIRHAVEVPDTPEMRGIIHKIRHLVVVE